MSTGLLWFDNTPGKSLEQIIREAAARFEQKFGLPADHACVNPADQADQPGITHVGPITVEPLRNILRHHVWISREADA